MDNKVAGPASAVGLIVGAIVAFPLVGIFVISLNILLGCVMGHAADLLFGETIRPTLNSMFGWPVDLPLSHVGASLGFLSSWLIPSIISNAVKAAK